LNSFLQSPVPCSAPTFLAKLVDSSQSFSSNFFPSANLNLSFHPSPPLPRFRCCSPFDPSLFPRDRQLMSPPTRPVSDLLLFGDLETLPSSDSLSPSFFLILQEESRSFRGSPKLPLFCVCFSSRSPSSSVSCRSAIFRPLPLQPKSFSPLENESFPLPPPAPGSLSSSCDLFL